MFEILYVVYLNFKCHRLKTNVDQFTSSIIDTIQTPVPQGNSILKTINHELACITVLTSMISSILANSGDNHSLQANKFVEESERSAR